MSTQGTAIAAAAELFASAITDEGLVHVFGPGHSHIIAEEAFNRTGGLACINPIVDRTGGRAETVEGYAAAILDGHELKEGEVMVISSNSGINPLPIEMAQLARARGLSVVAITSLAFSGSLAPCHSSGKRLFEIADVVLDNRCPMGDALVEVPGVAAKVGPSSSIASMAVLNATIAATIELLSARRARGAGPFVRAPTRRVRAQQRAQETLREPGPRPVHRDAFLLRLVAQLQAKGV